MKSGILICGVLIAQLLIANITLADPPAIVWTTQAKNTLVSGCFNQAKSESAPQFKTMFYGKMSSVEYDAFVNANATQLLTSCQCVVNRLTSEYSPSALLGSPEQTAVLAGQLSGEGGVCATNVDTLLASMRARMGVDAVSGK